jgi:hypothetical protein
MRKAHPAQMLLEGLGTLELEEGRLSRSPRPARLVPSSERRTAVEHARHLLDRLDLVAIQQRLRGESLAELYLAVERLHADSAEDKMETQPKLRLSRSKVG